ncbi:MAG: DUF2812 domain-containing protein [Chloroflexota bacterium]
METVQKIRWFLSWNDAKEEKWLRDMSAQGLHLKEVETPFWYTFEQGAAADYVYRLDYAAKIAQLANEAEYQQRFTDAGWIYLGTNRGWRYFRQEAAKGQAQEIYTDYTSKLVKYRHQFYLQLALLLLVCYWAFAPIYVDSVTTETQLIRLGLVLIFAFPLVPLLRRIFQRRSQT